MNTKMKVLSLALVGAFGFAGSAMAQNCPGGPTTAEGGAWSGKTQTQGAVSIVATGLESTPSACKLQAVYNAGAGSFASANVRDDSPQNETRYRAQFLINADGISNLGSFAATTVFSIQSAAAFPATGGTTRILQLTVSGGAAGAKKLNVVTSNAGQPNDIITGNTDLTAGTNRIEIEWKAASSPTATDGYVKLWVNNTTEATPTTINSTSDFAALTNGGWVGVKTAYLGLAAPNGPFRQNNVGQNTFFDAFDSRRTTFIGAGG